MDSPWLHLVCLVLVDDMSETALASRLRYPQPEPLRISLVKYYSLQTERGLME